MTGAEFLVTNGLLLIAVVLAVGGAFVVAWYRERYGVCLILAGAICVTLEWMANGSLVAGVLP